MGMIRRTRSRRFRSRSRSTSPAAASVAVRISLAAQNAFRLPFAPHCTTPMAKSERNARPPDECAEKNSEGLPVPGPSLAGL